MIARRRRHASFGPVDAEVRVLPAARTVPEPPGSRGAGALAAALIATLALHAILLHFAAQVLANESPARPPNAGLAPPIRLLAHAAPGEPQPAARPTVPAIDSPIARPRAAGAPEPARRMAPPNTLPDVDSAGPGYRFYGPREVDVTAEPVSEWNLDAAALEALATSHIVFTLFVGSDGSVLHCSIDEPERLSPGQRQALAARIAETAMRPARRGGAPVPSRRRVEIFAVGGL